jgi:hypothetical protein
VFSEKPCIYQLLLIQNIHERISIFAQTGCVYHQFIAFRESLKEKLSAGSYQDIDLANLSFNFHWENNVCFLRQKRRLKARMDESFIKIECQGLLSFRMRLLRTQSAMRRTEWNLPKLGIV